MLAWDSIAAALEHLGIDRLFGVPGTQTVELFEALRRSRIEVTLPTHELAASFMAGGYYRATGKVGVLVTIGGPGFTYALPGLAEARLDSVGLLHLVTAPAGDAGDRFQLQNIDQSAIAAPLCKGDFRLGPDDDPLEVLTAAYQLAASGEPGPVLVQLSARVGRAGPGARAKPAFAGEPVAALERLDELYAAAQRPLLLLGQGAFGAAEGLARIVDARRLPVVTTPSGRGVIREDHAMVMGFDALRGGIDAANELLERSDLVLALGARLGHNGSAGFRLRLPADRLVHIDREADVLGASYPPLAAVVADTEHVVERLERSPVAARHSAWAPAELEGFRARMGSARSESPEPVVGGTTPVEFFAWLRTVLPEDTVLVTDTGLHQILTRRHYEVRVPRGLLFPSDFQSMGFGLPAAIGAKVGCPHRPVAALIGDGGFLISAMELTTAVRDAIPLLLIVFKDGRLNQIRLEQLNEHGHDHAVTLGDVDYEGFAHAVGARHMSFANRRDDEIRSALASGPPLILEVEVGDSWGIRAMGAQRRVKSRVRDLVGPGLTTWLKERIRGA